jgi:hypothetical protein
MLLVRRGCRKWVGPVEASFYTNYKVLANDIYPRHLRTASELDADKGSW